MNIRKPADYTPLYQALDRLMGEDLPETALYFAIGKAVCARPEKGAAVMAAEHLQARYPERKGSSPRNLRRMRAFALAYGDRPELLEKALQLGWTLNVVLLERCGAAEERAWYLDAALRHGWTKAELLAAIQEGAWRADGLDGTKDLCYNGGNERAERVRDDEDPFRVSRQYSSNIKTALGVM